ncbi:MAG TPA: serine/threonine-protein kinase [Ktedonobacterales bacterium]|nr:serine/threonine-protein kinase [Ktedonobacterales bacterium]
MNQQEQTGATQASGGQCSNAACQTVFATPVQHCLTCGALLKGALISQRFRVEALIGRGGMGAVYRATDLALERSVAVKVLAPNAGVAGDAPQELRARFFREARVAAQLDHPNIVPVLHFDIDGPLAYLVMPLLTGGTLAKRLRPRQPTDPALVASWLHQVAAALDFGHHRPQPIVHRDVKPSNLLFHEDGRLCLADFGIARVAAGPESGEAAHLTRTGIVLGSLSYMAPEQINGRAVPASDQYSAGVVLYEALTGVLPFDAADNYGLIIQHSSATPALPSEHVPTLPHAVDAVVLRALAKQPEERFPTVSALAEAFEAALKSAPTAKLAGQPRRYATQPIAPRPTFQFNTNLSGNNPAADDVRGERPTEAATMMRPSAGWIPVGAPQMPPATPPRRNWWLPALFVGVVVIMLCVVGLAGLSLLNHHANPPTGQATATAASSPTATATPTQAQIYESQLLAAEQNNPIYQDALTKRGQWEVTPPGRFANVGLDLPTHQLVGRLADSQTLIAANQHQPVSLSDIEVQVTFSGAAISYGLIFPSGEDQPYLALVLGTQGYYSVAYLYTNSSRNTLSDLSSDPRVALTPNQTYHIEVLVQQNQFVLFLEKHFIAVLPITQSFPDNAFLGLFTNNAKNNPAADIVFSHLTIYPTTPSTSQ